MVKESIELPSRMTVAATQNEHSDLGALEELSDLESRRSGNITAQQHAAKGTSRGQVVGGSATYRADSYR